MKPFFILSLFCLLPFSTQAAESTNQQNMLASALDEYGKVAGAWFLNQRCLYITGQELKAFEEDVANITVALGNDIGNPQMLFMIQAGAKKATQEGKYQDCNGVAKELFEYGRAHAKNWSDQIQQLQVSQ